MKRSEHTKVTIKDVARVAGLSVSTVSNYLSGRESRLRPETRDLVARTIAELGYRPSAAARIMRGHSSRALGLLVPSITNPSIPAIVRGAEDRAREDGYSLFLANIDRKWEQALPESLAMIDRGVEGLGYAFTATGRDHGLLGPVRRTGTRMSYLVAREEPIEDASCIMLDNSAAMAQVAEHLWGLGHRRIAFASSASATSNARYRMTGLEIALKSHGASLHSSYEDPDASLQHSDWEEIESGRRAALVLLSRPERPTAICAITDLMAVGILRGAAELGLSVPGDVSVTGFDDLSLARVVSPTLTSCAVPGHVLGRRLIESLLTEGEAENEVFIPTLVVRESTGPATHR